MARSKSKAPKSAPKSEAPATKNTAGFYRKDKDGQKLYFAPTAVHFPGGSSILASKKDEYSYPVEGWSYYESAEAAYSAEGVATPDPKVQLNRVNIAEKMAARMSMTREEKEAERAERDADRISRLQATHPDKAAKLQARVEDRQARMTQRAALASMSPQERKAARLADLENRNPELAAKIKADEAARAKRLASHTR